MDIGSSLNPELYVLKEGRPHGHMGRMKNKDNTIFPIIWEGDASREDLKGFTITSIKILYFVNLKSALIELKKSVSRWTRTRTKISPNDGR